MTIDQYAGDTIAAAPEAQEAQEASESRPAAGELALLAVIDDDGWRRDALCAQTDPESFYPEKGASTREAKKVCHSCEVRAECLDEALANNERFGIWGGLSERERRKLTSKLNDRPDDTPAIDAGTEPAVVVTGEVIATTDDVNVKGAAA